MSNEDFEGYVAAAGPRLVRSAYLVCHDRGVAEDLVQEALARLHLNWGRINRDGNLDAYVWRSLINQLTSWRRKRSWHEAPTLFVDASRTAVDQVDAVTARDEVWRLLATLPARQRAAIVLRYYEDLADRDIAALLDCSEVTVRSHVAKGLAKLRKHLTHEGICT